MCTDMRPSLSSSPHADCMHVLVMCTLRIGLLIEPMDPTPCGHGIAFAKELRTFWVCMHASAHEAWHWQGGALRAAVPGQRAAPGGRRPGRRERAVARRARLLLAARDALAQLVTLTSASCLPCLEDSSPVAISLT